MSGNRVSTEFGATNAAVTTLEDLLERIVRGTVSEVCAQISNTGEVLNAFNLLIQANQSAGYETYLSGTDWDTDGTLMRKGVGAPATLASGATAFIYALIPPCYAYKFQAGVASSTTSVTIEGTEA